MKLQLSSITGTSCAKRQNYNKAKFQELTPLNFVALSPATNRHSPVHYKSVMIILHLLSALNKTSQFIM